jgi:hypothetical protein
VLTPAADSERRAGVARPAGADRTGPTTPRTRRPAQVSPAVAPTGSGGAGSLRLR